MQRKGYFYPRIIRRSVHPGLNEAQDRNKSLKPRNYMNQAVFILQNDFSQQVS